MEKLTVVVSVFNEERNIGPFWNELYAVLCQLDVFTQVIFVNDGSSDQSQQNLLEIKNDQQLSHQTIQIIKLSKNFGHEAAMIAGIDYAEGDVVICMDADLQHPPKKIVDILQKHNEGYDIVMMKQKRQSKSLKSILSSYFYSILNKIADISFEKDSSDFFSISGNVATVLKENFRERNRFIRGYIQMVGFSKTSLSFIAEQRMHGESNYSIKKLFSLALIALFSFSIRPLYFSLVTALLFILFSASISIYSIYQFFFSETPPPGYTSIIVFASIAFAFLFANIFFLSIYIGKNNQEILNRPIYIVESYEK